ncbi:TlpA family protein disulfide reductase [Sinomicrobium sp. M5D2P9]
MDNNGPKIIRRILFLVFICNIYRLSSQVTEVNIEGRLVENVKDHDSIFFFTPSAIDKKYYEVTRISSVVKDKKFHLVSELSYPHMFVTRLKSEENILSSRGGDYFIDPSTNIITIDTLGSCSEVEGKTHHEYRTKFVPFFYDDKDKSHCATTVLPSFRHRNGDEFDRKLSAYVKLNPDSFVALWFLIERFEKQGYTESYQKVLQSFSDTMKESHLWKMVNGEMASSRIKRGKKFPELVLQTSQLKQEVLRLPKAKYAFIDYWFSTCKPCLKKIPEIKRLFDTYHTLGFEVISIATDKTAYVENWQQVIEEQQLNWSHYLDENGSNAKRDKIRSFPTTFLLDDQGRVIQKNIPLDQLKELLIRELKH